jgi:hypothetical protein
MRNRVVTSQETQLLQCSPGPSSQGHLVHPHRPEKEAHFLTHMRGKEWLIKGEKSANKSLFQTPPENKRCRLCPTEFSLIYVTFGAGTGNLPKLESHFCCIASPWRPGLTGRIQFPLSPSASPFLIFLFASGSCLRGFLSALTLTFPPPPQLSYFQNTLKKINKEIL